MTPLEVNVLMVYYWSGDPEKALPVDSPARASAIQDFITCSALKVTDSEVEITELGRAWVKLICATPAPVHRWVDPREK